MIRDCIMKNFKIAVIAHNCRTGGGLFGTLNLIQALKNVAQDEQFMLVCPAGYGYEDIDLPQNSDIFVYKGRHSPLERCWFEKITLPKIIDSYNPDVIFGAGTIGITRPHVPQALFIRMPYLLYDKKYYSDIPLKSQLRVAALKMQVKNSLPATGLILTQTPVVRKRFAERFNYPEDQIKILRFATPVEIKPTSGIKPPSIFDKSSDNFYVLLLTRYMTHRNPSVLIPLCTRYGKQIRAKKIKFITTVEPNDHPHSATFLKQISKHHLEDVIINVGNLSRPEVLKYLTHSDVLCFPTTLETLGIPFLEAMTIGLPILTTDIDFAHYMCGDAAVFYNPWEIESMFNKLILLREDAFLRQELIEKGKKEVGNKKKVAENWEETASDLIGYLRSLAKKD